MNAVIRPHVGATATAMTRIRDKRDVQEFLQELTRLFAVMSKVVLVDKHKEQEIYDTAYEQYEQYLASLPKHQHQKSERVAIPERPKKRVNPLTAKLENAIALLRKKDTFRLFEDEVSCYYEVLVSVCTQFLSICR